MLRTLLRSAKDPLIWRKSIHRRLVSSENLLRHHESGQNNQQKKKLKASPRTRAFLMRRRDVKQLSSSNQSSFAVATGKREDHLFEHRMAEEHAFRSG